MPSNQTPDTIHELKPVFDLLYPRLCHFADQMIGDSSQAEDIVQEVFIEYWKNKNDLPKDTDVKKYLYQKVGNACQKRMFYDEAREPGNYNPQLAWIRITGEIKVKGTPWGIAVLLVVILVLAAFLKWWYTRR